MNFLNGTDYNMDILAVAPPKEEGVELRISLKEGDNMLTFVGNSITPSVPTEDV